MCEKVYNYYETSDSNVANGFFIIIAYLMMFEYGFSLTSLVCLHSCC